MPGRLANSPLTTDTDADGRPLSAHDREILLRPYLPGKDTNSQPPPTAKRHKSVPNKTRRHHRSIRSTLAHLLHLFLFWTIHFVFDIYLRVRKLKNGVLDRVQATLYYHHRTPELIKRDVAGLRKVPGHLSCVLSLEHSGKSPRQQQQRGSEVGYEVEVCDGQGGVLEEDSQAIERLVQDVAEIAAWSSCAGIPFVSIYERTGKKNTNPQNTRREPH